MISKACERCRRRKIKCDGETVCMGCRADPSACVYRTKARTKARRPTTKPPAREANSGRGLFSEAVEPLHGPPPGETEIAYSALCRDVTSTHNSLHSTGHLEIFYGPASGFAFLRHIHQAISGRNEPETAGQSLQGGELDSFATRSVFFGIPPRISLQAIPVQDAMDNIIQRHSAIGLLDIFKTFSLHMFPFFTPERLDELLDRTYAPTSSPSHQSHDQALLLAILASGSLNAADTNEAERLFQHANRQVETYSDAVTMPMVQFSLLMADYQLNMGRPNAAYLLLNAACCKAYALGLHRSSTQVTLNEKEIQIRRATLWTIYSYDNWIAFTLGRPNNMRKADIACPYPDNQPLLVDRCHIAAAMEKASASIYNNTQFDSLLQLYNTVESLHHAVVQTCKRLSPDKIHSAMQGSITETLEQVAFLNMYYNLVLTIYRPFLITESILRSSGRVDRGEMLWLRPACRKAIAAAEDCIALLHQTRQVVDVHRARRLDAFFIETSCALLLYSSLCNPSKHPSNAEFVQLGFEYMQSMVNDEPVLNAIRSVQRIASAVEQTLSKAKGSSVHAGSLFRDATVDMNARVETSPVTGEGSVRNSASVASNAIDEAHLTGYHELPQFPEVDFDVLAVYQFDFIPLDRSLFFGT